MPARHVAASLGLVFIALPSAFAQTSEQQSRVLPLVLVTSDSIDQLRMSQLRTGVGDSMNLLLRSASTQTRSLADSGGAWRSSIIAPDFLFISNSGIPFEQNDGALWAGKGVNLRALFGFRVEALGFRLIVAPELVSESNTDWVLRPPQYPAPAVPVERSGGGFAFPYYIRPYSIDIPLRFGDRPIHKLDPGQSSIIVGVRAVEFGGSTENEWWGPGVRNAIILSNNAPGFPHLFIRTRHPLKTRFGDVEARWLVGGLTESKYFDTVSTNNVRSIAAIAATIRTGWDPNLSIGFARSVFATATGWGQVPGRWFDILANTGYPNDRALSDSSLTPGGRDQLFSLFARWVFPNDGFETYGEWARMEFPKNLRDFLLYPQHSHGYTFGIQWLKPGGHLRINAEVTTVEQSSSFRDRPVGSFYTSRRVIQGYTEQGQPLGASIGPGSSGQWLAFDWVYPNWRAGFYGGRVRWNEDMHSTAGFNPYFSFCNHDVSIYPGFRGAKSGRFGFFSADLALQNRINSFFEYNTGGCGFNDPRRDIRNKSLTITYVPFSR
jgi:hypothetical protein